MQSGNKLFNRILVLTGISAYLASPVSADAQRKYTLTSHATNIRGNKQFSTRKASNIACRYHTSKEPAGQRPTSLLTPNLTIIGITQLPMYGTTSTREEYLAQGIVCDNLHDMDDSVKDYLVIHLFGALSSYSFDVDADGNLPVTDAAVGGGSVDEDRLNNVGVARIVGDQIRYYPPDEFNRRQRPRNGRPDDITKEATRTVYLHLSGTKDGQHTTFDAQKIVLARPPLALIYGINTGPLNWLPFTVWTTSTDPAFGQGIRIPFVAVNHNNPYQYGNLSQGNGPVEIGASLLSDQIFTTLGQVRGGHPITDGPVAVADPLSSFNRFEDYASYYGPSLPGLRLGIRRVDVLAWSYGGVITRWYIASRGSRDSYGWYHSQDALPAAHPVTNFVDEGSPIRKVLTLGSMWRGVPLVNYLNEAQFPSTKTSVQLKEASLSTQIGIFSVADLLNLLPIPTKVPSMEVMAVGSKWMSQLVFGSPNPAGPSASGSVGVSPAEPPASPFDANIAYGSVAGDNNNYPIEVFDLGFTSRIGTFHLDIYGMLNYYQWPSYFPYMALETRGDSARNFSDGLVPLWSAAIPGSYKISPTTHDAYPSEQGTREYVLQYLHHSGLPLGKTLNDIWNNPAVSSVSTEDKAVTWTFQPGEMAPYPQSDFYKQIDGIGRINPYALGRPSVIAPGVQATLTRVGDEIIANITVLNGGLVIMPDVQVTSATLTCGPNIGLPNTSLPQKLGTIGLLQNATTTVRFPGSIGASGARARLVISGTATLDTFGTTLRVTLP